MRQSNSTSIGDGVNAAANIPVNAHGERPISSCEVLSGPLYPLPRNIHTSGLGFKIATLDSRCTARPTITVLPLPPTFRLDISPIADLGAMFQLNHTPSTMTTCVRMAGALITRRLTRHSSIRTRSPRFLLPFLVLVHLLPSFAIGTSSIYSNSFQCPECCKSTTLPFIQNIQLILQDPWSLHPLFRTPTRDGAHAKMTGFNASDRGSGTRRVHGSQTFSIQFPRIPVTSRLLKGPT